MSAPQKRLPVSSVACSMLIAESVYRLVVAVERQMRRFSKQALPAVVLVPALVIQNSWSLATAWQP